MDNNTFTESPWCVNELSCLEAARWYLARGLRPIPWVIAGGRKVTALAGFTFRDYEVDERDLEAWAERRSRRYGLYQGEGADGEWQVGLALAAPRDAGEAGAWALDVDSAAELARWEEERGGGLGPGPTWVQRSGRGGGEHRLYLGDGDDWPRQGPLSAELPHLEVKSNGLLAVAPSRHPSGARYAWREASTLAIMRPGAYLAAELRERERAELRGGAGPGASGNGGGGGGVLVEDLYTYGCPPGGGAQRLALIRFAGRLAWQGRGYDEVMDHLRALVERWWALGQVDAADRWETRHLDEFARHALSGTPADGGAEPWMLEAARALAASGTTITVSSAGVATVSVEALTEEEAGAGAGAGSSAAGLAEGETAEDGAEAPGGAGGAGDGALPPEVERLVARAQLRARVARLAREREAVAEAAEREAARVARGDERFPRLDWVAAFEEFERAPEPRFLAGRWLEEGEQVTLVGDGKVGKSLLLWEWCARVVGGEGFLGDEPRAARRVLYLDRENHQRGVIRGMRALGVPPGALRGLDYRLFPRFTGALNASEAAADELMQLVAGAGDGAGAEVVVLDTVSRYVSGGENDAETWLGLYQLVHARLKAEGVACVRLDHLGKDADRGSRGSSAKSQDVDHVWELSRVSESVVTADGGEGRGEGRGEGAAGTTGVMSGEGDELITTIMRLARTHTRSGLGPDLLTICRRGRRRAGGWARGWTSHRLAEVADLAEAERVVLGIVERLVVAGVPVGGAALGRERLRTWARERGVEVPSSNNQLARVVRELRELPDDE